MVVLPPPMDRLRLVLDASGSFPTFATEFLQTNKIGEDFEVTPQLLDQFQAWLRRATFSPALTIGSARRNSSPTG